MYNKKMRNHFVAMDIDFNYLLNSIKNKFWCMYTALYEFRHEFEWVLCLLQLTWTDIVLAVSNLPYLAFLQIPIVSLSMRVTEMSLIIFADHEYLVNLQREFSTFSWRGTFKFGHQLKSLHKSDGEVVGYCLFNLKQNCYNRRMWMSFA